MVLTISMDKAMRVNEENVKETQEMDESIKEIKLLT